MTRPGNAASRCMPEELHYFQYELACLHMCKRACHLRKAAALGTGVGGGLRVISLRLISPNVRQVPCRRSYWFPRRPACTSPAPSSCSALLYHACDTRMVSFGALASLRLQHHQSLCLAGFLMEALTDGEEPEPRSVKFR